MHFLMFFVFWVFFWGGGNLGFWGVGPIAKEMKSKSRKIRDIVLPFDQELATTELKNQET